MTVMVMNSSTQKLANSVKLQLTLVIFTHSKILYFRAFLPWLVLRSMVNQEAAGLMFFDFFFCCFCFLNLFFSHSNCGTSTSCVVLLAYFGWDSICLSFHCIKRALCAHVQTCRACFFKENHIV